MKLTITVPGTPVADTRPRVTKNGVYDPRAKEKLRFRDYAKAQCLYLPPKDAVMLFATFIMPRPKSHYGTGRNSGKLKPSAPIRYQHTVKPDIDNLLKFVLDALNGIAYVDDKQVAFCSAKKRYTDSHDPRTIVEIEEA